MSHAVHDVLVVGGGPAGLSAAYDLVRAGRTPLVLERTRAVGDVWRHHYDGLRLNTGRVLSRLAGESIPRKAGGWPSRDDFVRHLEGFPARGGFEVVTGVEAQRVTRATSGQWEVHAADGRVFRAGTVVVATGGSRVPVVPAWTGLDTFRGRILHASAFRSAAEYRGQRVLVIGSGNSAAEIASRLTEHAAEVTCAVRTPPHLLPKSVLGIPMAGWGLVLRHLPAAWADGMMLALQRFTFGDLGFRGLPLPKTRLSVKFGETNVVPTLYEGFARDVKAGRIRIVGELRRFEGDEVVVDASVAARDGTSTTTRLRPDVVVAGTGYRSGLRELIDVPGLIDEHDRPRVTGAAQHPSAPGLFFIGQSNPLTGQLREIRLEAAAIGQALRRRKAPAAASPVAGARANA
jgi:putative flavoprotein involved in K+ transport